MANLTGRRARIFGLDGPGWAGLALVGCVFVFAAALTWRRWPDVLVDFGMQLYIPWRLSTGAVLYRDLYYFSGGPLSQYYNALLFKIFGVSFLTLILMNLAAVAAALFLIYRRFCAAADAWTAMTICLGIVLVFAFDQYMTIGNYNYVTPYSHEALHGLLLSILAVALLSSWVTKEQVRFALAAGFCSGLVFLTKPDIFMALAVCAAAAFVLVRATRRRTGFAAKSLGAFLLAGLAPLLGFLLFFLRVEDWRMSLRSVLFGWPPMFQTAVVNNPYYSWCMGLDDPLFHLRGMTMHFFFTVLVIAFYAVVLRRLECLRFQWMKSPWVVLPALVSPLLIWAVFFYWTGCGASLPLLSLAALVLLGWNYKRLSTEQDVTFPLLWSVFGLVLLLKLGFFARIWHYGFVLAMPSFVSAIYLLLWLLPKLLENKYRVPARLFRPAVWLVLMVGFGILFNSSESMYALKNLPVGRGNDRILTFDSSLTELGKDVNAALAWIEKNVPPDASLAVLPEGVTLNYLSRRTNPTPCLDWNPTMLSVFGQTNMTAAFENKPPDYILIVERDNSELGVGYFGHYPGYGGDVMEWIGKNYQPVCLIGNEPLKNGLFGIKILKRLPATN